MDILISLIIAKNQPTIIDPVYAQPVVFTPPKGGAPKQTRGGGSR